MRRYLYLKDYMPMELRLKHSSGKLFQAGTTRLIKNDLNTSLLHQIIYTAYTSDP